jgi:hypothetical protein
MYQPEQTIRVREVPAAERTIERRREDRIHPYSVGVHGGQRVEPTGIKCGILGKLGGIATRERHTEVHAFDVERLPALTRGYLKPAAASPGYQLEHLRTRGTSLYPVPIRCEAVEKGTEVLVLWSKRKGAASG